MAQWLKNVTSVQEAACSARDLGSIPGLGRSPGERKGYPLSVFWPGEFHGLYCPWDSPGQNTGVSGLSLLRGILPDPGIEPRSPALQADSLPAEPPGKPKNTGVGSLSLLQQILWTEVKDCRNRFPRYWAPGSAPTSGWVRMTIFTR